MIRRWLDEHREAVLDNAATAATTAGAVFLGVALGVKWAATRTAPELPQPEFGASDLAVTLTGIYNSQIETALAAAAVLLLVGVGISMRDALGDVIADDLGRVREWAEEGEGDS